MRTLLVVIESPSFDFSSGVGQTGKPVRIQAFIAQSTVEALDIGVLHRFARLDELQSTTSLRPAGRASASAFLVLESSPDVPPHIRCPTPPAIPETTASLPWLRYRRPLAPPGRHKNS